METKIKRRSDDTPRNQTKTSVPQKTLKKTTVRDESNPLLIRIGIVRSQSDIIQLLDEIDTSPDHLLAIQNILLKHMWHEFKDGTPHKEEERILRRIQDDIRSLYEIACVAKVLGR